MSRLPAQPCSSTPTFSDGTFNGSDWEFVVFSVNAGGTAVAGQLGIDGNPAPSRFITITIDPGGTPAKLAYVFTFSGNKNAIWNPGTMGAITTVDTCEDAEARAGFSVQATSVAVKQDGKIYIAKPGLLFTPNDPSGWVRVSHSGFQEGDFVQITGTDPVFGGHPDFSSKGDPIEFGFYRGNSGHAPGYTSHSAIDNWAVTVHSATPAAPPTPPTSANTPNAATTADPISTATGEYFEETKDLDLGGPLPLRFSRYYGSFLGGAGVTSALGANWMHNFEASLRVSDRTAVVTLFRGKTIRFAKSDTGWQLASNEQVAYQFTAVPSCYTFLDLANTLIYTFSAAGALTSIADRNGNTLTVARGAGSPGPDQVSDSLGRTLTFSYLNGKLTRVQDQGGRSVLFTYNGSNLVEAADPAGNKTRYAYAANSALLTTKTLPSGDTILNQSYDSQGRISKQADALSNATSLSLPGPSTNSTTVVAPGAAFTHLYDNALNLVGFTDAVGQSAATKYDSNGRRSSQVDRFGDVANTTYQSPSGRIASFTDATGDTTRFTYVAQTQGPFTYYNRTRVDYSDSTSESFVYDTLGNVVASTDRAGKTTSFVFNSRGQVTKRTSAAQGVTSYNYNGDGTLASTISAAGDTTFYKYDSRKQLTSTLYPDGSTKIYEYDENDRIQKPPASSASPSSTRAIPTATFARSPIRLATS